MQNNPARTNDRTNQVCLNVVKTSPVFRSLSETNLKFLAEHSVVNQLKKGSVVWRIQNPSEFCIFVMDGLVEIHNETQEGQDYLIGLFGPSDICGLSAILKREPYPATAIIASKQARIMKMFIRSSEQGLAPQDKDNLLTWQRERLLVHEQILREKITILCAGRLQAKLFELFNHFRFRFAPQKDPLAKKIHIPIPITKTQVAKLIEARVETVIRELNKWEKAGHLKMDADGVTLLDFESLRSRGIV